MHPYRRVGHCPVARELEEDEAGAIPADTSKVLHAAEGLTRERSKSSRPKMPKVSLAALPCNLPSKVSPRHLTTVSLKPTQLARYTTLHIRLPQIRPIYSQPHLEYILLCEPWSCISFHLKHLSTSHAAVDPPPSSRSLELSTPETWNALTPSAARQTIYLKFQL